MGIGVYKSLVSQTVDIWSGSKLIPVRPNPRLLSSLTIQRILGRVVFSGWAIISPDKSKKKNEKRKR
jgi:hypothetical protein